MATVALTVSAVDEPRPGTRWRARYARAWPGYRRWFLRDGEAARPSFAEARRMLRAHMPELVPVWERLVELAGGGDLAARFLAMYDTPPLAPACSQAVYDRGAEPALVRNYDFHPDRFEGVIAGTALAGRRVVGTSDCMWGLLDGLNEGGLAASITFGGERSSERGFAIPIVVRYLLETCDSVADAVRALAGIPIQTPYNLTLLDRGGDRRTLYLRPGGSREARFMAATNHQDRIRWPQYAEATCTVERRRRLLDLLADHGVDEDGFISSFLRPPIRSVDYRRGFGTLYTAVIRPRAGTVEYLWPGVSWRHSVAALDEGSRTLMLSSSADATPLVEADRPAARAAGAGSG